MINYCCYQQFRSFTPAGQQPVVRTLNIRFLQLIADFAAAIALRACVRLDTIAKRSLVPAKHPTILR